MQQSVALDLTPFLHKLANHEIGMTFAILKIMYAAPFGRTSAFLSAINSE